MKLKFNKKQLEILNRIGFGFDVRKDLSDDEYFELDEKVSDYLMKNGFDDDYKPNAIGQVCESIMDILSKH